MYAEIIKVRSVCIVHNSPFGLLSINYLRSPASFSDSFKVVEKHGTIESMSNAETSSQQPLQIETY